MDAAAYIAQTQHRLVDDGNSVGPVTLPSGTVLVGYQSHFKMKWMATKLHLFTVVVAVHLATPAALAQITKESLDYAKQTKGQRRGLQTGVAVIPALVADIVDAAAKAAVQARPDLGFAAMVLPAIVDVGAGRTYSYEGKILVGALYAGFLRERLHAALPPPPPNG